VSSEELEHLMNLGRPTRYASLCCKKLGGTVCLYRIPDNRPTPADQFQHLLELFNSHPVNPIDLSLSFLQ
jgi:hypothetical protein